MKSTSRGIYLLPNLFTTFNLFCGYYAIIKIIQSVASDHEPHFAKAGAAILIAILFDSVDGHIARLTKTTSRFGLEYDSLADLTSFCLAPALLLYTWGLDTFGKFGWLAAFLYFGCGALRLARFNVESTPKEKNHFKGLPSPVAAGLVTTMMMIHPNLENSQSPEKAYLLMAAYVIGILMVSNIRFRSFKEIQFHKKHAFSSALLLLIGLIVLVDHPVLTLLLAFSAYTISGVFGTLAPKRKQVGTTALPTPPTAL